MAYRMMSESEFHDVVECFMTTPSPTDPTVRERAYYRLASRRVKHLRTASGDLEPMVSIAPRHRPADVGLYPMRSLFFVLSSGEIVR